MLSNINNNQSTILKEEVGQANANSWCHLYAVLGIGDNDLVMQRGVVIGAQGLIPCPNVLNTLSGDGVSTITSINRGSKLFPITETTKPPSLD